MFREGDHSIILYAVPVYFISLGLMLALAILDFGAMHLTLPTFNYWMYKYWLGMAFLVTMIGFSMVYGIWIGRQTKKPIACMVATFLTVIIMFISGALDNFYYLMSYMRGEHYGYEVWSAQYKWWGYWDFRLQMLWFVFWTVMIFVTWKVLLRRGE